MKKWIPALALCVLAAGIYLYLRSLSPAPTLRPAAPLNAAPGAAVNQTASSPSASQSAPSLPIPQPASPSLALAPSSTAPSDALQFTNIPPDAALDHLRHVFHQYASMFGGNPVGTNPEITAALHGENPKQANFIDAAAGMRINANGELIDPWGTPYFFHQLSGQEMEIHSAGPDHKMWTADDLVVK